MISTDNEIELLQIPNSDISTLLIGQDCLKNGLRIDGRSLDSYLYVSVDFDGPPGNSLISFGNTVIFTCVSQEIVEPNSERPNEGFLFFNVETSFTSECYEPGKTTDQEHNLIYFLENMFKESSCLDLETLCITSGKQVLALRVYVHVLQDDGNLLSACSFSALASLLHYRKPLMELSDELNYSFYGLWHKGTPLNIYHVPILVTVWLLETRDHSFLDHNSSEYTFVLEPNSFEQKLLKTQIIILFNQFGEVLWIYKNGSTPVPLETFESAISASKQRASQLYSILMSELDKNTQELKNILKHINSQYPYKIIYTNTIINNEI
ncbi:exosome complex exonuclease, putative [Theileria annulata]|uniref:Exosome complex exonuclease, putative n=1 Tax=Theileria annulata TaxID=5874 RepID=Q4UFY0_THEAN|nr:exosome complex exonuclease, putative [Theileria annulata]CAI74009.1 exosome complex exonuclease, putative [Theileria annulata]|eukprot:XP_954689.1 exosome complex exonuclease, putative [Theileria annulata]